MSKLKVSHQNQGFSLVEVLVAILLTTFFVTTTMQAVVIATLFKVKSQENTESTNWIQQEVEDLRHKTTNFKPARLTANTNNGTSSIAITVSNNIDMANFNTGEKIRIGTDTNDYKITAASGSGNNGTITISPALKTTQTADTTILPIKMCTATSNTAGLGDALRDSVWGVSSSNSSQSTSTRTIKGKEFTMIKTARMPDNPRRSSYNVLRVEYDVKPSSGTEDSVAKFYTEVIPNVAFQCQ